MTFNITVQVTASSAEDAEAIIYNTLSENNIDAVIGTAEEV